METHLLQSTERLSPSIHFTDTVIIYLAILTVAAFGAVFTFSALIKRFHNSHCFLDTPFKFNAHRGSSEVFNDNNETAINTTTNTSTAFSASLSSSEYVGIIYSFVCLIYNLI